MQIGQLVGEIENFAPPKYQESYDNSGLIIGNVKDETDSVLVCLDVTEEVLEEALKIGTKLIVAHHPLIFGGLKRINGNNYVERTVIKAIKHGIAVYAVHTNIDMARAGVSYKMAEKIGLTNIKVLQNAKDKLNKLVAYVPVEHAADLREALFKAGSGVIGRYDSCSFNIEGNGTFRGGEGTAPYVGEKGKLHFEKETRIETILPDHLTDKVVNALIEAHPYEEVAYDIFPIKNDTQYFGFGAVGELKDTPDEMSFLGLLKETFQAKGIRYTALMKRNVKKVALCGGSGSFLLNDAIRANADVFVSADFKYHQFFDADNKIMIADIGHYESEQFTLELIYDLLIKKFPKFAVHLTTVNTNPVKYL